MSAFQEAGADGRLRVKYDAQRGGELEDESTLRWLRERLAVGQQRRAA